MMDIFVNIRDELITASHHEDANIPIDYSLPFKKKAIKCAKIMDDVKFTAVSLQKILLTLKECRELLDMLISEAKNGKNNRESPWYKNQFGKDYVRPRSEKLSGPDFTSGIIKIQNKDESNMTQQEEESCINLLINNNGASVAENVSKSFQDRMSKRKKRKASELEGTGVRSKYHNLDYIGGSAAEVERLWSEAKFVLTAHRAKISPIVFEALIFLKFNQQYWDIFTVKRAYINVIKESRAERLSKIIELHKEAETDDSIIDK